MTGFGKAAIAVAGIGTVGGGVGLGFHLLSSNNPTVSTKLTSEGFELASTQSDWTALFTAHDKLKEANDPVFKDSSNTNKNWQWLQAKCKEALNKEDKDNTSYLLARQWCVKETSISSILGKAKLKVLNEQEATSNANSWNQKLKDLNADSKAISSLALVKTESQAIAINDLKDKCTPILAIKTTDKDFNEKIKLAKSWCSIPNN